MKRVAVLVLKGAMPSGVAVTLDVLDTANRLLRMEREEPAFDVVLEGSGAAAWRHLAPKPPSREAAVPDIVVVPGLGHTSERAIQAGLAARDAVKARHRLEELAAAGADIAGSCSATFLLASAGLLDGRRATTTWWLAPLFRRMFPKVRLTPEALVVTDGPITTAGAALAQVDLMLALVARHAGLGLADLCARYMVLDARRSQLPYATVALLAAGDERVARAEAWAREHLEGGVSVDELAAAAGLTPRTFARRVERATGLSPVRFLQRLRIERAVDLVRSTRLPLDEIAQRVGYAEPSTLRRLLRREGRVAPPARRPASARSS